MENNKQWSEREVINAVNASCSCGGKGPDDGCCEACEVWHRLNGRSVVATSHAMAIKPAVPLNKRRNRRREVLMADERLRGVKEDIAILFYGVELAMSAKERLKKWMDEGEQKEGK